MRAERDDALYQSKIDRSQFRVMKKKTKKTVDNAVQKVQDAQSAVHCAREIEEDPKKQSGADVKAAYVRELKTTPSCQVNIDKVKVDYHHNLWYQAKRAATVFAKEKVNAQNKLKNMQRPLKQSLEMPIKIFLN